MRSLRISVLVVLLAILLPFAVILRSYGSPTDHAKNCDNGATWYEGIGKDRDGGLKLHEALKAVSNMVAAGRVTVDMYPWVIAVIADVYAHPEMTPAKMRDKYRKDCYRHHGIVET